jgi:hypothetical protein
MTAAYTVVESVGKGRLNLPQGLAALWCGRLSEHGLDQNVD